MSYTRIFPFPLLSIFRKSLARRLLLLRQSPNYHPSSPSYLPFERIKFILRCNLTCFFLEQIICSSKRIESPNFGRCNSKEQEQTKSITRETIGSDSNVTIKAKSQLNDKRVINIQFVNIEHSSFCLLLNILNQLNESFIVH